MNTKKRGRGRPRKNPLPDIDESASKREQTMHDYLKNFQEAQQVPAPLSIVSHPIIWDGEKYVPYLDLTSPKKQDKGKGRAVEQ
jgi:hypothetical protein